VQKYDERTGTTYSKREYIWLYEFPPIADARAQFDKTQGGPFDWQPLAEQTDLPPAGGGSKKAPF
jgi:hypothetical protein